ncbi:hypothetical protein [Mycobacterium sp. NPDC050853]|uniref:microaggregate invasion protein 1 n=1 Tax=Mycobacterium sp. NPDC050853 TaxID=3155160 RepID=UPI0034038691
MAYEFEAEEWRAATHAMTESERAAAVDEHRAAIGLTGDRNDARDEMRHDR